MFNRFLGLAAARNHPQPSVEDLEDIKTLDTQIKAWHDRAELFFMQGEPLRSEAAALGVDLDCFSELPPGASKELRDWADENDKLEDLADNLLRLDASRKQLRLPLVTGSTEPSVLAASCLDAATAAFRRRHGFQPDKQLALLSPSPMVPHRG